MTATGTRSATRGRVGCILWMIVGILLIIAGVYSIIQMRNAYDGWWVATLLTIVLVILMIVDAFIIGMMARRFILMPYLTASRQRTSDNIRELAQWTAHDPQFADTSENSDLQATLRVLLAEEDVDAGLRDRACMDLMERNTRSRPLAVLLRVFSGLYERMPRRWEELDRAYRQTMRDHTNPLTDRIDPFDMTLDDGYRLHIDLTALNEE